MLVLGFWKGKGEIMDSFIEKVFIDREIYDYAVEIGNSVDTEVGFYMVGFVRGKHAYVIDVIEFPYKEKSYASVESDILRVGRISALVPLGLSILGTMHKHPDGIGSQHSGIDEDNYRKWARVRNDHVHVIFSRGGRDVSAYTVVKGRVKKIPIKIIDKSDLGDLKVLLVELNATLPIVIRESEGEFKMREIIENQLLEKLLKRISPARISELDGEKYKLEAKKAVMLSLPRNPSLVYEVIESNDVKTIGDVKKIATDLLGVKGFDYVVLDGKPVSDHVKISDVENRIVRLEESIESKARRFIESELKKLQDRIEELESSLSLVSERVSRLEDMMIVQNKNIEKNTERLSELLGLLDEFNRTMTMLKQTIEELKETEKKEKEEEEGDENEEDR